MSERLLPYLEYLAVIHPDLKHQLAFLIKFSEYLYAVFRDRQKSSSGIF
jgi:hypothetical protein